MKTSGGITKLLNKPADVVQGMAGPKYNIVLILSLEAR